MRVISGKGDILAKDNYSYKKYKRELAKKKKREEKMQRKLDKKNVAPQDNIEKTPSEGSPLSNT